MADPLSISASVAGLVTLAASVTKSCYGMYREVKNAPRMLKDVIDELSLLSQVLGDFKDICDQSSGLAVSIDAIEKEVAGCTAKLELFETHLGLKYRNPRSIVSRIRWSLGGAEIKAFVNQLQIYRGLFDSAKTNATLQLTIAIRKDLNSGLVLQQLAQKEARLRSIVQWLSPIDFSEQQREFFDTKREPCTGEWIERNKDFLQWRDRAVPYSNDYGRTLWCRGPPGSGKTILCSVLVNNLLLLPGTVAVAYMYCSGQQVGTQTAEALVGSLVKQLAVLKTVDGNLPQAVEDIYDRAGSSSTPDLSALISLLTSLTKSFEQVYLVADGVDELEVETLRKLIDGAESLIPRNKTKFLIFSRPHIYSISKYLNKGFVIEIAAQESDVREYLIRQIKRNDSLALLIDGEEALVETIVSKISLQSQGQFALAYLHFRRVSEETSKASLISQLDRPSQNLKEEYMKGLARVENLPTPQRRLALRTLNYMWKSKLLLTADELQEALSVDPTTTELDVARRPPMSVVLAVCQGFVVDNPISGKVEFFHFTLSEFLGDEKIWTHLDLDFGGCCVAYLLSKDFKALLPTDEEAAERRRQHPFSSYASRFWADMIRGPSELKYEKMLQRFVTSRNRVSCFQLLPPGLYYDTELIGKANEWSQIRNDSNDFAVYTCSYLRLGNILPSILQRGLNPECIVPIGSRFSPLHVAAKGRNKEICKLLLDAGLKADIRDKLGRTPLHYCYQQLDQTGWDISELLINAGASINAADHLGQTVLHHAILNSSEWYIRSVLVHVEQQNVNAQDRDGNAALHFAVRRRYTSVFEGLLNKNADPLLTNSSGQSSLDNAMIESDLKLRYIVKSILMHADSQDCVYKLSYEQRATIKEYLDKSEMRQTSFRRRRRPEDNKKPSPLGYQGLKGVTREAEESDPYELTVLLVGGAAVNFVDSASGMTPLHHAVLSGHELPVWHLLAAGARSNMADTKHGVSAETLAERGGKEAIMALFRRASTSPLLSAEVANPTASVSEMRPSEQFTWQRQSYQVGRGMWAKQLSGSEVADAYRRAEDLREAMSCSSSWSGPGLAVWYEYLGIDARRERGWVPSSDSDSE